MQPPIGRLGWSRRSHYSFYMVRAVTVVTAENRIVGWHGYMLARSDAGGAGVAKRQVGETAVFVYSRRDVEGGPIALRGPPLRTARPPP